MPAASFASPTMRPRQALERRSGFRSSRDCTLRVRIVETKRPRSAFTKHADSALALLLVAAGWLRGSPSYAQQPDRPRGDTPVTTAHRTTGTIHVDGRLDEPDWGQAPPIGPLTQREPLEGRDATEQTDVRILFDEQA